jgi:hypothetical protein
VKSLSCLDLLFEEINVVAPLSYSIAKVSRTRVSVRRWRGLGERWIKLTPSKHIQMAALMHRKSQQASKPENSKARLAMVPAPSPWRF